MDSTMSLPQTNHYNIMPTSATRDELLDDSSFAILSPPLSPYPKHALPVFKLSQQSFDNNVADSPTPLIESYVASPAADEPVEIHRPLTKLASSFPDSKPEFGGLLAKTAASKVSKPAPVEPALSSNAWNLFKKDPIGYYKRERSFLDLYPVNGPTWSNYVFVDGATQAGQIATAVAIIKPVATRPRGVHRRSRRTNNVSSDNDVDSDSLSGSMTTRSSNRGRERVNRGNTPLVRVSSSSRRPTSRPATPKRVAISRSNTASPAPSRVHDTAISQLVDYSPSAASLPAGKSLRAEWKGAPMDLSSDPLVREVHPAELHLASVLRLPLDVYLDSKKRLFAEKVYRLRQGLPFRRTDSQKACRIDVNKASRLFSAYERVGWLEDELFAKYL